MKPIPNLATPETPAAFVFGYMYPQQNQLWVIQKYWPEGTLNKVQLIVGPSPSPNPAPACKCSERRPPTPLPTGTASPSPSPSMQVLRTAPSHPTPHRYSQSAPPQSSSTSTSSRRCTRNGSTSQWTFARTRTPRKTSKGGCKRCGATRSRPPRSPRRPLASPHRWVQEMWGYSIAAASLGIQHKLVENFQV